MKGQIHGVVSRGVKEAYIDNTGHLFFVMTDNSTVDLGLVVYNGDVIGDMKSNTYDKKGGARQVAFYDELHEHENKAILDTITTGGERIEEAVSKSHKHINFNLLEEYTQTERQLKDAVEKKHTHANRALLDELTQETIDQIDALEQKFEDNESVVVSLVGGAAGWGASAPYTQTIYNLPGITAEWKAGTPVANGTESMTQEQIVAISEALSCIKLIASYPGTLSFIAPEERPEITLSLTVPRLMLEG